MKPIVFVLMLLAAPAWAVDRFACDCQTGADPSCAAQIGNNANAGTSSLAPRQTLAGYGNNLSAFSAGDRLLLCRGGSFALSQFGVYSTNATPTNPITIEAYGTGPDPLLRTTSGVGFQVGGGWGNTDNDGGYVFRNLRMQGLGNDANHWGFWMVWANRNTTIENVEVTGYNIGMNVSTNGLNATNYLTIRRSNFHHNSDMGMLGGGSDWLIEDSDFSYNNQNCSPSVCGNSHGIYWSCNTGAGCNRMTIRRTRFVQNSTDATGRCLGGNLTAHGRLYQVLIEDNEILQNAADVSCAGISWKSGYFDTNETFERNVLRGNRIVNVGACAICINTAPGIVVENNIIQHTNTSPSQQGIAIIFEQDEADAPPTTDTVVRNNTVIMTQPTSSSRGISVTNLTGHTVVGNSVYLGSGASSNSTCFNHTALINYAQWNRNHCYRESSAGAYSATYATLSAAQAAGFDTNGSAADPLYVTAPSGSWTWSCAVSSGSPLINAGGSSAARLGWAGAVAAGTRDIGACEFGSTQTAPSAPGQFR